MMNPRQLLQRVARRLPITAEGNAYRLIDREGKLVRVRLVTPDPVPDSRSSFLFGIVKGGSTLLHRMAADILREAGRKPIDLPGYLFEIGHRMDDIALDEDGLLEIPGATYIGFRFFPPILYGSRNFERSNKLLLVRDPRDVLVSLYYSHAYSHNVPNTAEARKVWDERRNAALSVDIDSFALDSAHNVLSRILRTAHLVGYPRMTLLRYEDTIFDKGRLIDAICATAGITLSGEARKRVIERHDIIPKQEDKYAHIRNVAPGDHARKLKPETIRELDRIMQPAVSLFYPDGIPTAADA